MTKAKSKSSTTNAISLLKADHVEVKDLFDQFEESEDESEKYEIAQQAIKELKVHSTIEEEIFYPAALEALQSEDEDTEIMEESEEEHRVAKTLIEELSHLRPGHEHFEAKFIVLAENVRHHIKEEEGEMFKCVKETDLDLEALGEQMKARKEELLNDEGALEEAVENSKVQPYQELAHN
jgi:hypothetical protein